MIRKVLDVTGITATAGIGTNLYLAKVAMDIVAKHSPADEDGVRLAELDEKSYRKLLWDHRPLTDFWRVGKGISTRLERLGLYTMGDIAEASLSKTGEDVLYKEFGINAELLIDHAWGWEPVTFDDIHFYHPAAKSLSSGQVLKEPYDHEKAQIIVREMTELLVRDLVRAGLIAEQFTLTVGYDPACITETKAEEGPCESRTVITETGEIYEGRIGIDIHGRRTPFHAHGTGNLVRPTNSARQILPVLTDLYEQIADPRLLIRRINIAACGLQYEENVPEEKETQMDLFTDCETTDFRNEQDANTEEKEKRLQKTILQLQDKYGKNTLLKGLNFREGATSIERNGQIGGHRAG
jgi:DNA polymerase V